MILLKVDRLLNAIIFALKCNTSPVDRKVVWSTRSGPGGSSTPVPLRILSPFVNTARHTITSANRDWQKGAARHTTSDHSPDSRGEMKKMQGTGRVQALPRPAPSNSCCPGDRASTQLHGDERAIARSAVSKERKHQIPEQSSSVPCVLQTFPFACWSGTWSR